MWIATLIQGDYFHICSHLETTFSLSAGHDGVVFPTQGGEKKQCFTVTQTHFISEVTNSSRIH